MTTPVVPPTALDHSEGPAFANRADRSRADLAPLARAILAHALAVGVSADLLIRDGPAGIGYPIWLALLACSVVALAGRADRTVPHEAGVWLATALAFGTGMAWRAAGDLHFLDFLATLFALGMAAIALGSPRSALFAERLRDTVWSAARALRSIAAGLAPLVLGEASLGEPTVRSTTRARPVVRAVVIALPLLVIFGSLLRGADPVFASLVAIPALDIGTLLSHLIVIGFFSWTAAGWMRAALVADIARPRAPGRLPFALGSLDITVGLGVLIALFALYLVTQLGWFFGGEQFLRERTGLTVAEYARQGFLQMVWVVLLVVPTLMASRALLLPDRDLERRHTVLAIPILLLVGLMIVSAMLRLQLYVRYYGLTIDRLYALVFIAWLSLVLVWLGFTVLRGAGRTFVAGAVVSGLVTLAALNVVVPDVVVARLNIARSEAGVGAGAVPFDVAHIAGLGGDAIPLVVPAVLRPDRSPPGSAERLASDIARCRASHDLLARWSPFSERRARHDANAIAWRRWNRGEARAVEVVGANVRALREVEHTTCRAWLARRRAELR
ncbi:MAG: DUF4173 domain-containing protein [Gemmatimonadaceae bacterium]